MPEVEKHRGGAVVIGGDNLPSPVRIGLTDLQNIGGGGAGAPPGPPGSGITVQEYVVCLQCSFKYLIFKWGQE